MKKSIYRKLKDYIYSDENYTTSIFGTLYDKQCNYCYKNDQGEWCEYHCLGNHGHEMDFLLNYYVIGIQPYFEIEYSTIKVYLRIVLSKSGE